MRSPALVALVVATGSAACMNAPLNRATLNGTEELGHTVRDVRVLGFQVVVVTLDGNVRGELLAVGADVLWIQTESDNTLAIPRATVEKVRVYVHDTHGGAYAGWTAAGGVSTLTHGWYFALTAPAWALVGGLTTGAEVGLGRAYAVHGDLDALCQYARFPQGPPPALLGGPAAAPSQAPPAFVPTPESLRYAPRSTAPTAPPVAPPSAPRPTPAPSPAVSPVPVEPTAPLPEIPPAPLWYELPVPAPPVP